MKEALTETELCLMSRAAGAGTVCPKNADEKEAIANLVHRALLRKALRPRRGAARLTRAGWGVLTEVYEDKWAD
jgi:hypothetical protein